MAERMDELVDEALANDAAPTRANERERIEIEAALRGARALHATTRATTREAAEAKPVARARFERFLKSEESLARSRPARARRVGRQWWARGRARGVVAFGALAGALVLVAVVALALPGRGDDGAETALALSPGDYAEVAGVVREASGEGSQQSLVLDSSVGRLRVTLPAEAGASGAASLQPGAAVVVGGIVGADRAGIAANSIVPSSNAAVAGESQPKVTVLRSFREGIVGTIVTFAVAEDGGRVRVVLRSADGERLLVPVAGLAAQQLLESGATVGATVRVVAASGGAGGFALERTTPGEELATLRLAGIVTSGQGRQIVVQTARGEVRITIAPATRIVLGQSGLTRAQARDASALVGRKVVVAAEQAPRALALTAQLLVVGERAQP